MKIKFGRKIKLTEEQITELSDVLQTPDMGWNYNVEIGKVEQIVDHSIGGEYGIYECRVNLPRELITVMSVYTLKN